MHLFSHDSSLPVPPGEEKKTVRVSWRVSAAERKDEKKKTCSQHRSDRPSSFPSSLTQRRRHQDDAVAAHKQKRQGPLVGLRKGKKREEGRLVLCFLPVGSTRRKHDPLFLLTLTISSYVSSSTSTTVAVSSTSPSIMLRCWS